MWTLDIKYGYSVAFYAFYICHKIYFQSEDVHARRPPYRQDTTFIHATRKLGWYKGSSIWIFFYSENNVLKWTHSTWSSNFFLIKKIRIKPRVNGSIHTFISFYKPNWHLCQVTPYLYGCILGYPRDKSSWLISTWVRTERKVESLALVLFLSLILVWFVSWTWLRAARIGCADLYC